MMPLIVYQTLDCLSLPANACHALNERCIRGIEADEARCAAWVERGLALVTPPATRIGYDQAA